MPTLRRLTKILVVGLVVLLVIDIVSADDERGQIIRRRKKIKKKPEIQQESDKKNEKRKPEDVKIRNVSAVKEPVPPLVAVEELKKIMMEVAPISEENSDIKYISLTDEKEDFTNDEKVASSELQPVTQKPVIVVENRLVMKIPETEEPVNKERIITESMLFRSGVDLDYSYNETAERPEEIVSVPGCPKSVDGYPWVLYRTGEQSIPKCYLVGQHSSVCHGSGVMNYRKGKHFGACACNFQECLQKQGLPLKPGHGEFSDLSQGNHLKRRNGLPGKLRYRFCRPIGISCEEFVYDQKEKRCDILYTRGPCKKGEWLQHNSMGGVECAKRLCEEGSGLSERAELFQRSYGNVTTDNAECCRPWGGFAVASVITAVGRDSCETGKLYSEAQRKCVTPFKSSGLIIG